jgi:hypothetical protein
MADHGRVAILFGKFDGIQGFGERADLVHLDQNRISDAPLDPFAEELDIVTSRILTSQKKCARRVGAPLLGDSMPPDAQVVNGLRMVRYTNWMFPSLGKKIYAYGI